MTADTADTFEIRVLLLHYLADSNPSTGAECTTGIVGSPEDFGREYYNYVRRQVYYQLKWLISNGYVSSETKDNKLLYTITTLGRELID